MANKRKLRKRKSKSRKPNVGNIVMVILGLMVVSAMVLGAFLV